MTDEALAANAARAAAIPTDPPFDDDEVLQRALAAVDHAVAVCRDGHDWASGGLPFPWEQVQVLLDALCQSRARERRLRDWLAERKDDLRHALQGPYTSDLQAHYRALDAVEAAMTRLQTPADAAPVDVVVTDALLVDRLRILYTSLRDAPTPPLDALAMYACLWLLAEKLWTLSGDRTWHAAATDYHTRLVALVAAHLERWHRAEGR